MKYLTNRDKALAEAKEQLKEAVANRNVAAITRAVKAEKDALALTPTITCFKCRNEFEQGNELIICAVGILRKRMGEGGAVETTWLSERDIASPVHLALCPDCDSELSIETFIR